MKKIISIFILIILCNQIKSQILIGGGFCYGTKINSIGGNLRSEYNYNKNWAGMGGLTLYWPHNLNSMIALDFNVQYKVESENILFYPLMGINLIAGHNRWIEYHNNLKKKYSDGYNDIGINTGFGIQMSLKDNYIGFSEFKYAWHVNQAVITVGILTTIK